MPQNGRKIDKIDVISGMIRNTICDIVSSYFCFSSTSFDRWLNHIMALKSFNTDSLITPENIKIGQESINIL